MTQEGPSKLIIVSNRLPCVIEKGTGEGDEWTVNPGSGGLITALAPVLRKCNGVWIGWPGTVHEDDVDVAAVLEQSRQRFHYRMHPVAMPRGEKEGFYEGFANQVLWPLFHCLNERCNFSPHFWSMYELVNRRFADATQPFTANAGSFIWVHDYHLMLVAQELRRAGARNRIGYFLHTPFPPPEVFLKLPWRMEILRALLAYDLVGFQTIADRRNFVGCVRTLLRECQVRGQGRIKSTTHEEREIKLGSFPISIDFDEFAGEAVSEEVKTECARLKQQFSGRKLILGIDRLDYTKGIPSRLRAFRAALSHFPDLPRAVTFVQVVVPSRGSIGEYRALRDEIEQLVGEINGQYGEVGYVPLQYMYRVLSRTELLALYRVADVCLVTPLNDGMNLVAKEYCACNVDNKGVLILSEFAGAAAELQRGAILVNPYDYEGMAQAIHTALTMPADERRARMQRARRQIRRNDVHAWADAFLRAGLERGDPPPGPEDVQWGENYAADLAVHELVCQRGQKSASRLDEPLSRSLDRSS